MSTAQEAIALADEPNPLPSAPADAHAGGHGASRFKASIPMDAAGIADCLCANRWGTLATIHDGRPYAIPLIFGWDGELLYFIASPGRKTEDLIANPDVCFTVTEVAQGGHRWRSVVVLGTAELVADVPGRISALRTLRAHLNVSIKDVGVADVAALAHARVVRVRPREVTGRSTRWTGALPDARS